MSFEHFIITRYNLKKDDWQKDVEKREVLDENWIKSRNEIFLKFCLPSVLNQSCKQFKWLLFFQNGSEESLKLVTKELAKYDFIEPIFLESYDDFQENLSTIVRSYLTSTESWILTTRLDNDDAIHHSFIERLQKSIDKVSRDSILHFPYGLFLDLSENKRLASSYYPMNQFISLLEKPKTSELLTVLANEHDKWNSEFSIVEISLRDAWLQITHSRNLINRHSGHPAYSKRLKAFGFKIPAFPIGYNEKIFIKRFLKFKS